MSTFPLAMQNTAPNEDCRSECVGCPIVAKKQAGDAFMNLAKKVVSGMCRNVMGLANDGGLGGG